MLIQMRNLKRQDVIHNMLMCVEHGKSFIAFVIEPNEENNTVVAIRKISKLEKVTEAQILALISEMLSLTKELYEEFLLRRMENISK